MFRVSLLRSPTPGRASSSGNPSCVSVRRPPRLLPSHCRPGDMFCVLPWTLHWATMSICVRPYHLFTGMRKRSWPIWLRWVEFFINNISPTSHYVYTIFKTHLKNLFLSLICHLPCLFNLFEAPLLWHLSRQEWLLDRHGHNFYYYLILSQHAKER